MGRPPSAPPSAAAARQAVPCRACQGVAQTPSIHGVCNAPLRGLRYTLRLPALSLPAKVHRQARRCKARPEGSALPPLLGDRLFPCVPTHGDLQNPPKKILQPKRLTRLPELSGTLVNLRQPPPPGVGGSQWATSRASLNPWNPEMWVPPPASTTGPWRPRAPTRHSEEAL